MPKTLRRARAAFATLRMIARYVPEGAFWMQASAYWSALRQRAASTGDTAEVWLAKRQSCADQHVAFYRRLAR